MYHHGQVTTFWSSLQSDIWALSVYEVGHKFRKSQIMMQLNLYCMMFELPVNIECRFHNRNNDMFML
jgi:hypothetical protein